SHLTGERSAPAGVFAPFVGAGGIVVGIGRWHFGADGFAPGGELRAEGFGPVRKLGREVGLFADIAAKVVEFEVAVFVELDEFPVAFADGARRSGMVVMGIVPVDGVAL